MANYKYKYTRGIDPKRNADGTFMFDKQGDLIYQSYVTDEFDSLAAVRMADGGLILPAHPTDEELMLAGIEKVEVGANPLSLEEQKDALLKKLDRIMYLKAKQYGYDNIVSAITYKDSHIEKFRIEGAAFKVWRDETYARALTYFEDVVAGKVELPKTDAELFALMPKFSLDES